MSKLRAIAAGPVALATVGITLAVAGPALAEGTVCVPAAEGAAVVTPVKGGCKAHYTQARIVSEPVELSKAEQETLHAVLAQLRFLASGVAAKPTVQFTGVNVQILSGAGDEQTLNGEGNLIVGYDEVSGKQAGSNNLIVGLGQSFPSFGDLLAGDSNTASGPFSVAFGTGNTASGNGASVLGGNANTASREGASVTGGEGNHADASAAVVVGGTANHASGDRSVVSGGSGNEASGRLSTVTAGSRNTAGGFFSTVSGGLENAASGENAAVSGGTRNAASSLYTSVSGGILNDADGQAGSISGGYDNKTTRFSNSASILGGAELELEKPFGTSPNSRSEPR